MSRAVASVPQSAIYDSRGYQAGQATPATPSRGGFLATLVLMTLLAGATGPTLAWLVHDRMAQMPRGEDQAVTPTPLRYSPGTSLYRPEPVIANLRQPRDAFIRVDFALVIDEADEAARTRLGAEIAGDVMAYLRTLDLARLEGASGLQFLREDLNERATIRSEGRVRELIIETLVVQ
ncbi:MAG: flagellar basal body-associated FliL family protein [Salinarimonas sp.]